MPLPILRTKLFIPPVRANSVDREALNDAFINGLLTRLTLVSAPAGFGKSTLVQAALAHSSRAVAWVSLDEADSPLGRFLHYVIAALREVSNDAFAESVLVSLDASSTPSAEHLITALLNELASWSQPTVLVLDDYHRLDNREIDAALELLIDYLPPTLHVVIITREDPPLPLARLRAKGQMNEFRAAELRFSLPEAQAFLSQTMQLTLDSAAIAALEQRTEGWIAGLQMAALSLQNREHSAEMIEAFSGSHRFVLDYLAEEVLQQQDPERREFLLQTAFLPRMNAELCDAVTGKRNARSCLDSLDAANLFLVPLDDQRDWYRYHHLFADVLQSRLRHDAPELLRELQQRASDYFWHKGQTQDAIQQALDGGHTTLAAERIEHVWPELRKNTPEAVLLNWLKPIPAATLERQPVLCAHYGMCLMSGQLEQAEHYYQCAEQWLALPPALAEAQGMQVYHRHALQELPALLAVGRAYQAGASGDMKTLIEQAQKALEQSSDSAPIWQGAAAALLAMVHWGQGELNQAYKLIKSSYDSMQAGDEFSGVISTQYLLANLHISMGQLQAAERLCQQAQKRWQQHPSLPPQGSAEILVTRAAIAVERYELEAAERYLQQARQLGPQAVMLETAHWWQMIQAQLALSRGEPEIALQWIDEAEQQKIPSPAPDPLPLPAWRARIALRQGMPQLTEQWLQQNAFSAEDEADYLHQFEHLCFCEWLLARFDDEKNPQTLEDANTLLLTLHHAATAGQRSGNQVEIELLLAQLASRKGLAEDTQKWLGHAIELAARENWLRLCIEQTSTLPEALKTLQRSWQTTDRPRLFLQQILTAQANLKPSKEAPSPANPAGLLEPLSQRELDVLKLLTSELSGPEIASRLFVSLNTLRTHSKNIYAKLAVNSRRSAVKKAQELGIL